VSRTARPARTVAVAAAVAAGALTLAACSPTETIEPYAPSDGSRVDITPSLRGVNLLVVTPEKAAVGALQGGLVNKTAEDVTYTLTAEGASPVTVEVPAYSTVYLGTEGGVPAQLDTVAAEPGSTIPTSLEVAGETLEFALHVFDGTLPEYAAVLPTPSPAASGQPTGAVPSPTASELVGTSESESTDQDETASDGESVPPSETNE
jgi:hypothetical protein